MNYHDKLKNKIFTISLTAWVIMLSGFINCATPRFSVTIDKIPEYESKLALLKEKSWYNPEAEEELLSNYTKEKNKLSNTVDKVDDQKAKKIRVFVENPPDEITETMVYDSKTHEVISRTYSSTDKSFEYLGSVSGGPKLTGMLLNFKDNHGYGYKWKGWFFLGKYNETWRNYFCKINTPLTILLVYQLLIPTTWPCIMKVSKESSKRKKYFIEAGRRAAVVMGGNTILVYRIDLVNLQTGQKLKEWSGAKIHILNYYGKGSGRGKVIKIPDKSLGDSEIQSGSSTGTLQAY
ncbi:MAG: hypothetical protein OEZ34_06930 [Spirochaetia bacterium]|nr:hypothetical protein [Spirochaetia bacterium]